MAKKKGKAPTVQSVKKKIKKLKKGGVTPAERRRLRRLRKRKRTLVEERRERRDARALQGFGADDEAAIARQPAGAADESGPGALRGRAEVTRPPVVTAPNLIEVSDFSDGYVPDVEPASLPPTALQAVMNLLPDIGSGTLQTRKGFKRLVNGALDQGYLLGAITPYQRISGGNYLMIVGGTGTGGAGTSIKVWSYNLDTDVATSVSTRSTWVSGDPRHYGIVVGDIFYGGGPSDRMYGWSPSGGWLDSPSIPGSYLVWGASPKSQADYAFEKGEEVLYTDPVKGQRAFAFDDDLRYKKWANDEAYDRGDLVSHRRDIGGVTTWRSYKAKKAHDPNEGGGGAGAAHEPGTGAWAEWWKAIKADPPADAEGLVSKQWNLIPSAPKTNLGTWHGERMWLRADDLGAAIIGKQRLLFSPPGKPKAGQDVSQLHWSPEDWRIGDIKGPKGEEGDGGGWEDFRTGDGDIVTALQSYGTYLVVFKRKSTWVLAGLNRQTWHKRMVATVGAIGTNAACEHEGVVYFIGDEGFFYTDGTQVYEAPGAEIIREWLRDKVDWDTVATKDVSLVSFGGFVWISLPTDRAQAPNLTLVYDPNTTSFWPQSLAIQAMSVTRKAGIDQLFFSMPSLVGTLATEATSWVGTPHRSHSLRGSARNRCSNPSFEPRNLGAGDDDWQSATEALADSLWSKYTPAETAFVLSSGAALRGELGAVVTNTRRSGSTMEGIFITETDLDTSTHTISAFIKYPFSRSGGDDFEGTINYDTFRFRVGGSDLALGVHTYTYVGNGWWRVSATYTGSTASRDHGFVMRPGISVHADKVMIHVGGTLLVYFDGDSSDQATDGDVSGGTRGVVYHYNHPDVRVTPLDDGGGASFTPRPISWFMRTAWFPFGVLREDRRIRRIWAQVRGVVKVLLRGYRNYRDVAEFEVEQLPSTSEPITFHEGRRMPDGYAVNIGVEGIGAPAAILGVAIDTQPRRVRYHNPVGV